MKKKLLTLVIKKLKYVFQLFKVSYLDFSKNDGFVMASALTLYSLLSIVPLLAMTFVIAKGLDFQNNLRSQIEDMLSGQSEAVTSILDFAEKTLNSAQSGIIAGFGGLLLLYSAISLLNHIRKTFNKIWNIKNPKGFKTKILEYTAYLLFAPLLFIISTSISTYISTHKDTIEAFFSFLPFVQYLTIFLAQIFSFILIVILIAGIYILFPDIKVNNKPAFISSLFTGLFFTLFEYLFVDMQMGVSRYNAIYGSFSALPLFIIWLQVSWIIVLMGGSMCKLIQQSTKEAMSQETQPINFFYTKKIALRIMDIVGTSFNSEDAPLTISALYSEINVSKSVLNFVLEQLVKVKVIYMSKNEKNDFLVQPYQNFSFLNSNKVIKKLEHVDEHLLSDAEKQSLDSVST